MALPAFNISGSSPGFAGVVGGADAGPGSGSSGMPVAVTAHASSNSESEAELARAGGGLAELDSHGAPDSESDITSAARLGVVGAGSSLNSLGTRGSSPAPSVPPDDHSDEGSSPTHKPNQLQRAILLPMSAWVASERRCAGTCQCQRANTSRRQSRMQGTMLPVVGLALATLIALLLATGAGHQRLPNAAATGALTQSEETRANHCVATEGDAHSSQSFRRMRRMLTWRRGSLHVVTVCTNRKLRRQSPSLVANLTQPAGPDSLLLVDGASRDTADTAADRVRARPDDEAPPAMDDDADMWLPPTFPQLREAIAGLQLPPWPPSTAEAGNNNASVQHAIAGDIERTSSRSRAGLADGACGSMDQYTLQMRQMLAHYAHRHAQVRAALDRGEDSDATRTLRFKCVRGYGGVGDMVKALVSALLASLLSPGYRALFIDCELQFPLETVWLPCHVGNMSIDWRWDRRWDEKAGYRGYARYAARREAERAVAIDAYIAAAKERVSLRATAQRAPSWKSPNGRPSRGLSGLQQARTNNGAVSKQAAPSPYPFRKSLPKYLDSQDGKTMLYSLRYANVTATRPWVQPPSNPRATVYFEWFLDVGRQNLWYLLHSHARHLWFTGNTRVHTQFAHTSVFNTSAAAALRPPHVPLPQTKHQRLADWHLQTLERQTPQRGVPARKSLCALYARLPSELWHFVVPNLTCRTLRPSVPHSMKSWYSLILDQFMRPSPALARRVLELSRAVTLPAEPPAVHPAAPASAASTGGALLSASGGSAYLIGLHVRIGKQPEGSTFTDKERNLLTDVPSFIDCAEKVASDLASLYGPRQHVAWIILGDRVDVRAALQAAAGERGIVVIGEIPATVMHVDRTAADAMTARAAAAAFVDVYAEMALLSAAHGIVRSKSGFSRLADNWGGAPVVIEVAIGGECTLLRHPRLVPSSPSHVSAL